MKKKLITLSLLLVLSFSLKSQVQPKFLVLILTDFSESANEISKPNEQNLVQISQLIQKKKGEATILVGAIGNVVNKNFLRLNLLSQVPIPAGLRLDKVAELAMKNRNISSINHTATNKLISEYRKMMQKKTPVDFSDVEIMFQKAEQALSEPAFIDYQKVLIFSSDLKNDTGSGVTKWSHKLKKVKNLWVFGLGVHEPPEFLGMQNFAEIQSFSGVNQNLDYILTK